jgi:hypothetical protein
LPHLAVHLAVHLAMHLAAHLAVHLAMHLAVHLAVHLVVYLASPAVVVQRRRSSIRAGPAPVQPERSPPSAVR